MRVLVTRPLRDAEATATRLAARGHEAILAPVIEIVAIDAPPPRGSFEALIVTSAHAVELAPRQAKRLHATTPVYCVGDRTAEAAKAAGFCDVQKPAPDANELARRILSGASPRSHFLYLAGRDRKSTLEDALRAANHHVETCVVYEARALEALPEKAVAALCENTVDAVLHLSKRSAQLLLTVTRIAGASAELARALHVCISADAAAPLQAAGMTVRIAATPDSAGLFAALESV